MALSPLLAERPALVAGARHAYWRWPDGRVEEVSHSEALKRARTAVPILCHAPATARRLKVDALAAYDLLELFAFVHPARFVVPSAVGLAQLFGLREPQGLLEAAALLPDLAELLLADLEGDRQTKALAWTLAKAGWAWGPAVLAAIGLDQSSPPASGGLNIWDRLPQWQDEGPLPPPTQEPVSDSEARQRLSQLLSADAEARPQQADFASALTLAFQPRLAPGNPRMILAEAGTGVGKTLGYIAPASLWAEKNKGTVYLSTFTRNLQQQLDRELDRLYPDPAEKAAKVVIRKGRENYLCLLNFEEAVHGLVTRPGDTVAVALMARWASASRDGDMVGGDFPGWLPEVIGQARTLGLTDRRGECIYSACPHYSRCFIERSIRKAKRARLVVANHALVLTQAVLGAEEGSEPQRLVFDEGHHLFGAADEAFAAELSGLETVELRRWLLGGEGGRSATRLRGLKRRLDELASGDEKALDALDRALMAARALPGEGWTKRLEMGEPQGPTERFLGQVRLQVLARNNARDGGEEGYDLEADAKPANEELLIAAQRLGEALADLMEPLAALRQRLLDKLEDESEELESDQRRRLDGLVRSLERRAILPLSAWRQMLVDLAGETPKAFIDWLAISRIDARARDVGYLRHYVDPLQPFAERVLKAAHGVVVTSATLTDSSGDTESDWKAAEERTGARHLEMGAERARVPSPFDYAKQTKVLIVGDVARDRPGEVAAAYQALFQAAGGGGLGLFTSIARLKAVQQKIAGPLEEAGLQLYAQHVDRMDTATLVELFRAEEHSCLLGTDAVRDGVDVPGRALRLIVFEKVPWPRADIRHRARREHFGKRGYDDLLTRLKLRQAFGRLIRRADDQGVFVLLEAAFPSRLATAFPPGVAIERIGLKAAIEATRAFLNPGQTG